jgi:cbb3-type cytochrome oxidase maturation protein
MTGLLLLIPIAVFLGLLSLAAFLWALRSGQYEDLEGAGQRILEDDQLQTIEVKPCPVRKTSAP